MNDDGIDEDVDVMVRYISQRNQIRRRLFAFLRRHGARGPLKATWITDRELVAMVDKVRKKEMEKGVEF